MSIDVKKLKWNVVEGDEQTKDELFTDPILIHCPMNNKSMRILEHYEIIKDDSDLNDICYYAYAMFTNGESELLFNDINIMDDNSAMNMCQVHFENLFNNFYNMWVN